MTRTTKAKPKPRKPKARRSSIPRNTDWIPVVAGCRVPTNILLWLWQEYEGGGANTLSGLFHDELQVFVDRDGSAVELEGRVTHYHVVVTPHGDIVRMYGNDEDDDD